MDQREMYLRLWLEEQAQIRHRRQLALLFSAGCLVADAVILGLLMLSDQASSRLPTGSSLVWSAIAVAVLGVLGMAMVTTCRWVIEQHRERAARLHAGLVAASDGDELVKGDGKTTAVAPPDRAALGPAYTAHLLALATGIVLLLAQHPAFQ
ncbi:hypothetical protein [Catellatospora bangladeshensis]|uniref:Uncharacterized protein n=1 Tax=Catellatospora bangladeshensis TaxID=310355 RepID=A0A8J3JQ39_9ACTN|nr:hypothetical protein [Catellatospora bangladeshensis]GIF84847.1 hypothetical protein Cba03nite_61960 [Catellatospora bangladeshensis]